MSGSGGLREPYRCGDMAGFRYAELDGETEERIRAWVAGSVPPQALAIKPERVYRDGALLVKRFPPELRLRDRFRSPRPVRSADLARSLDPIRTALPYLALSRPRSAGGDGLLVTEFIEGHALPDVGPDAERASAAFPLFIAQVIRHGFLLGDFHVYNALWDGSEWALLDLDGLRHGGHALFARRLIETLWGRVWVGMGRDDSVRGLFEAFLTEMGSRLDPRKTWERVVRRANRRYPPS